jgi:hypothetical protein
MESMFFDLASNCAVAAFLTTFLPSDGRDNHPELGAISIPIHFETLKDQQPASRVVAGYF